MTNTKSKTFAAIAFLLTLSIAVSLAALPSVSAHAPAWKITTYAYVSVAPNPIGVGQTVNVYMWLYNTFDSENLQNDYRFHNYQLKITAPNGNTETKTFDIIWDTTSSQYYTFTPDQTGDYKIEFNFPGQDVNTYSHNPNSAYVNDTYLPSSASTTLTVQEEAIPGPTYSYPLPTEYWTRPIYGENTDWWSISSDWLGSGSAQMNTGNFGKKAFVYDAVGPLTSHIMWTKPLQAGGVVGGSGYHAPGVGYFEGSAYINRYNNPIVINGKIYYMEPLSMTGGSGGPTDCVDLRTGEVIWSRTDVPLLSFGYIYDVWDPNQHGTAQPILFTSNFARAFDADSGTALFNVTGVPTGAIAPGQMGEQLRYTFFNNGTTSNPNYYLCEWNSSNLITGAGFSTGTSFRPAYDTTTTTTTQNVTTTAYINGSLTIIITPVTTSTTEVDAARGSRYDWLDSTTQNASTPWLNTMKTTPLIFGAYPDDMLLCANGSLGRLPGISAQGIQDGTPITYFAVNLNPDKGPVGSVLWRKTYGPVAGNKTIVPNAVDPVNRVFLEEYRETVEWVGYSMDTGDKLWGPTPAQTDITAFDYYGNQFSGHMLAEAAYGNFYVVGFAGVLYCYDITTGQLKWTYGNGGEGNSTNSGFELPYGNYPTMMAAIGNGVIYMETTEHTVTDPIYKGSLTRAVNATDGTEIWTLSDYTGGGRSMSSYAIADGFATFFNGYDNQIYVVGRGPSAVTVEAPKAGITLGGSLVISGTVTDISAGTEQSEQASRFPNGVPCVSDASMTAWMEYVYQQKPLPTDCSGVQVSIDVLDSNNNYRNIGSTTTDLNGAFSYQWTPDIPGKYTVIATFAGTNGYWPSHAENSFAVDPTPEAAPGPTATPASMAEQYFLPMSIGLIIAMAVVIALLALLLLRRRP